ncbi:hypothetical protein BD414DRAFT_477193 [Trametes punicea]|nr:hypothetical protein BD414DRAFT_477193 [Trametes punicea]
MMQLLGFVLVAFVVSQSAGSNSLRNESLTDTCRPRRLCSAGRGAHNDHTHPPGHDCRDRARPDDHDRAAHHDAHRTRHYDRHRAAHDRPHRA